MLVKNNYLFFFRLFFNYLVVLKFFIKVGDLEFGDCDDFDLDLVDFDLGLRLFVNRLV